MSQKIVIFGSIVQDLISYTKDFPRPGESVRGISFLAGPGGKGANQAVAAAKLGANVAMIGRVGDDMFADANISSLSKAGVDASAVKKCPNNTTATATITVNSEGENSIVVTLGANLELDANAAQSHEQEIASASLLLAQAEITEAGNRKAFEIARKHGVTTFFNPAPGDSTLNPSILELVDIVCTNENEAEFLTGLPMRDIVEDAKKAALRMLEMGPQAAIVTLGASGVVVATKEGGLTHVEVPKVQVVDTTGAGDCFCGSLAALLVNSNKKSIADCVRIAAVIAGLSVQRKGTQLSYWSRDEIEKEVPNLLSDY